MTVPPDELRERVLEELRHKVRGPRLLLELRVHAIRRSGSEADADDLVQDTTEIIVAPDWLPWKTEATKPIDVLTSIVNSLWANRLRRHDRRKAVKDPKQAKEAMEAAPDSKDPEALNAERELEEQRGRLFEELVGVLEAAGDAVGVRVVELTREGFDTPEEQAGASGIPKDEIVRASKRVQRQVKAMAAKEAKRSS